MVQDTRFEPTMVGFLCRWCSYAGADAAGRRKRCVHAGLRPLQVPCAGRVDPRFVVAAFTGGADGVAILACHPGDCHYRTGNAVAGARAGLLRRVLEPLGIAAERVYFGHLGAAEGDRLAAEMAAWVERLRPLGPLQTAGATGAVDG